MHDTHLLVTLLSYICITSAPYYTLYLPTPLYTQFPRLVEHNPMIAAECLALIYNTTPPILPTTLAPTTTSTNTSINTNTHTTTHTHTTLTTNATDTSASTSHDTGNVNLPSEARIQPYLNILLSMDMNLQNVEVVNKLITMIEVPLEFVYKYITLCMSECTNIKDKYLQVKTAYVLQHLYMRMNILMLTVYVLVMYGICIYMCEYVCTYTLAIPYTHHILYTLYASLL